MTYDALVVGGGIAGCSCAQVLAEEGYSVLILEKTGKLGGKVAEMGCKAADSCSNCGVCLSAGLWGKISENGGIETVLDADVMDCSGSSGAFRVTARIGGRTGGVVEYAARKIVVATGYLDAGVGQGTNVEISGGSIITGAELEALIRDRNPGIFAEAPGSVAFLQCYGSRDTTEKAPYCSRVCCAYASRCARLIRKLYPDTNVEMFFMDIQRVGRGCSEKELTDSGITIVRARPEKVRAVNGKTEIQFESGGIRRKEYDLVVLSCGIAPGADNEKLAELFGLGYDPYGFLREVRNGDTTGVYVAGCAGGPKRIEEARADAIDVAVRLTAANRSASNYKEARR